MAVYLVRTQASNFLRWEPNYQCYLCCVYFLCYIFTCSM